MTDVQEHIDLDDAPVAGLPTGEKEALVAAKELLGLGEMPDDVPPDAPDDVPPDVPPDAPAAAEPDPEELSKQVEMTRAQVAQVDAALGQRLQQLQAAVSANPGDPAARAALAETVRMAQEWDGKRQAVTAGAMTQALKAAIPEWSDAAVARREIEQIREYARRQGYTPEQMEAASVRDVIAMRKLWLADAATQGNARARRKLNKARSADFRTVLNRELKKTRHSGKASKVAAAAAALRKTGIL